MKVTKGLFGNPFANFDRTKTKEGFSVSAFVDERQQDVFYIRLRVYCPALLNPALQTIPVRLDGTLTRSIELGGSEAQAQGLHDLQAALLIARVLHAKTMEGLANVFELFSEQEQEVTHGH